MNTKYLMTTSALFLGIFGILLSFFPQEITVYLKSDSNSLSIVLLQIFGSFYLGFGILNWMTKNTLIGGIYNKPLVVGNLMHFGVSTIVLLKIIFKIQTHFNFLLTITLLYLIFTLCFVCVFMTNPSKVTKTK